MIPETSTGATAALSAACRWTPADEGDAAGQSCGLTAGRAAPTPLELLQQVHRTPDGTRQLVVDNPRRALLRPAVAAKRDLSCAMSRFGAQPPAGCLHRIERGRFYLLHVVRVAGVNRGGVKVAICASCAVREYAHWGVREAAS